LEPPFGSDIPTQPDLSPDDSEIPFIMLAVLTGRPVVLRRCFLRVVVLEDRTVPTAGYFRIAEYNIASSGSTGAPRSGLDTILDGISKEHLNGVQEQLDVIALQEVKSQSTTCQDVATLLNTFYNTPGVYKASTLDGGSTGTGTQGLVYNQLKLQLNATDEVAIGTISTSGQPRQALRYKMHPIGYPVTDDFYIYNSHYKAGDTSGPPSDESRREPEAIAIRADSDALNGGNDGPQVLYVGDFNVYNSNEAFYQHLLSAGTGQAFDPINTPGAWHNSGSFVPVFTQAPAISPPSGLTGGGLDDRFDFQLFTGELTDGLNFDYVPSTYHTFGNNGSVAINKSINDPTSTALPDLANRTTVLNLLTTVSDHLPTVADYRVVPAKVAGTPQINDGSAQRSMITSLKVTFNEVVSLPTDPGAAFTLTRQGGGTVNLTGTVSGNTVTLTFTGGAVDGKSLSDGRYTLTALASQINNGTFDGNGDGTIGDDYTFASALTPNPPTNIFRIYGDVDGDGSVGTNDFVFFRQYFNSYLFALDFDGDNIVSTADFAEFRQRFNTSI
jgi:endonuclease/exonuclease/phosphatase family metal-dependent hydrolase